jgi:hypothetical protein
MSKLNKNIDKTEPYVCKLNEDSINRIKEMLTPLIPKLSQYFTSQHMTLFTLLWSLILVASGFLARRHKYWFLVSIISLVGHVITDLLDGEMSLYLNDGLQKWNFFMDHLLDFVLTISVFIGLSLYFYRRNTKVILPIFMIFTMIIINMAASFLLVAEKGLDLGIKVHECLVFNIFHMHILLTIFYIFIMLSKKINGMWLWFLALFIACLTAFNIYMKQEELKNKN